MAKPHSAAATCLGEFHGKSDRAVWLVAYTRARHECAVARQLESKDVAFLLPKFVRMSRWSDRTQRVMAPLYPGYLGVVPRRLVLVIRDISETIRTRELLREREVMATTGTLLAGVAHQAKNAIFGLSATLDAFEARIQDGRPRTCSSRICGRGGAGADADARLAGPCDPCGTRGAASVDGCNRTEQRERMPGSGEKARRGTRSTHPRMRT